MPERFGTYRVVNVGSSYDEYYDIEPYPYTHHLTPMKTLYRGDTWIPADMPMAHNVDRKTLSEHKQPKVNPQLEVDDIIRVIEIDGEHANMPDVWGIYKVHDVRQDNTNNPLIPFLLSS